MSPVKILFISSCLQCSVWDCERRVASGPIPDSCELSDGSYSPSNLRQPTTLASSEARASTPGTTPTHVTPGSDPESTDPRHSGPLPRHSGLDPESTQNPRHSGLDPESTQNPRHSGLDPESTLFSDYSPRDYGREYRRLADARPAARPWRWSQKIIKEFK